MARKSSGILTKVIALLCVVVVIFSGGFLFLDKLIVPKYFGQYGIKGLKDLVSVVSSLYSVPNESKFVTLLASSTSIIFTSAKRDNLLRYSLIASVKNFSLISSIQQILKRK